jgi:hypothetical protein
MAKFPTDATFTLGPTTYSMVNRRPDRNYQIIKNFENATFVSQIGYEKRRQLSRRSRRSFSFQYTSLPGYYKAALENFYDSRSGDFETFEFDLSYAGQSGTILVRFASSLNVTQVIATDNVLTDIYNVSFTLQESFS